MPILNIEIVGHVNGTDLAQSLADAATQSLGSDAGGTWVKVHFLPEAQYAENGGLDPNVKPVFVSVLLGRCSEGAELRRAADSLAQSVANILSRPKENVHVLFEPGAIGRIAFGGKLLEG